MRKTLAIVGTAVLLALIGGYVFMHWSERQVLAEVERQFASLRAAGVTADYGAVRVGLRTRSVEIDDVRLGASAAPGVIATIARVKADGIAPSAAKFTSSKLHLADIAVASTMAGPSETRFTLKIPELDVEGLETPTIWPVAAAGSDRGETIGTVLQVIAAGSVSVPRLEMQATLPVPPQSASPARPRRPLPTNIEINYVYSGITLTGIGDGKIATMDVADAQFTGTTGSGTMKAISNRDVDLMPFFGVGLAGRQQRDGFYRVQGKSAIGPMTIKLPDGGAFGIGSITSGGMSVDPTRFTYQKLMDLVAVSGSGGQPPSAQQMTQMMGSLADLYEGIHLDAIEMRNLAGTSPGGGGQAFALAGGSMTGLTKGKLASMRIDGLDMTLPPLRGRRTSGAMKLRVGGFEIKGFDFAGIFRKVSMVQPRPGQPPPSPEEFLTLIEGVELTDATVPDPTTGLVNKIERAALAWGRPVNGIPADIKVALKGDLAVNPSDPNHAALRQLGLSTLAVDLEFGSSFDGGQRQLTLAPVRLKAGKIGQLDARVVLGDVAPTAYSFMPARFAAALPGFAIRSVELEFIDDGMLAAVNPPLPPGQPGVGRPDVAAALKNALIDPAQPPGNLTAIVDSLGLLLREGNRRMSLKLTANETVRIADFAMVGPGAAPGTLAPLFEKFAIDVKVGK